MDTSKFKHNPTKVNNTLIVTETNQLRTSVGCTIYFPTGYVGKGLAMIGSEVSSVGIFAIVLDDNTYAVSMCTGMVNFGPCKYDVVEVGGEDHYALTFEKGSVVFLSTNIMKGKKITAPITDYFIDYGHVPWFIDAVKHAELIRDTDYFNGVRLGGGQPVYDMMVANIARDPKDIRTQWRHTIKTEADITKRPLFIPLRDIAETTTSNFARLNGSELKQGIKSALLANPDREEPLESIFIK